MVEFRAHQSQRLEEVLSPTACRSCRSLKIRCSRWSPTCSRCQKKRITCVYPEPPNRRLLAARRNGKDTPPRHLNLPHAETEEEMPRVVGPGRPSHASNPTDEIAIAELLLGSQPAPTAAPLPLSSDLFPISSGYSSSSAPQAMLPADDNDGTTSTVVGNPQNYTTLERRRSLPEREIGLLLIEVYFSRVFSASLLYDHKGFVESYRAGALPEHTLLSTFAVSSLFFRDSPVESCGKKSPLAEFSSLGDRGREWAQWASELVLANSDTPTLAHICSCDVLSLFWFALGETERSVFHASVSQTSFHLLDRKAKLDDELWSPRVVSRERVRWACFIKSCISEMVLSCHSFDLDIESIVSRRSSQQDLLDSLSFTSASTTLDGHVDWLVWDETFSQTSVIYILEIFRLWRKIKNFVLRLEKSSYQSCLSTFFELDGNLQQFYASLPSEFKDGNLMDTPHRESLQRNAFFTLSVYHLSMMFLHSSLVPALSTVGNASSPSLVKISSKTATSHAEFFVKMTRDYLNTTPDVAKIPSFVGYCAFVAGMVLSAVMSFIGIQNGQAIRRDGAICALLLWELKVYWPVLECFYQDLETHFHLSEFDHYSLISNDLTEVPPQGSPKRAGMEEPGLAAFIAASCDLPYSPKSEFIHRPYTDDHVEHSSTAGTSPAENQPNSDNGSCSMSSNADPEIPSTYPLNTSSPAGRLAQDLDLSTPSWSNIFAAAGSEFFERN